MWVRGPAVWAPFLFFGRATESLLAEALVISVLWQVGDLPHLLPSVMRFVARVPGSLKYPW